MAAVIERVDSLEQTVQDFVTSVGIEFKKLYRSQLKAEAELRAFQEEMLDFKEEMRMFKDEVRRDHRQMNKRWGELANKLGTLVEDLVAPSLPRIIEEKFKEPVYSFMTRPKRWLSDKRMKEFDAVAVTAEHVFLNSTKSTLRTDDVDSFGAEIALFRTFFPEHAALPLVGVLASLAVDKGVLAHAEKQGFLVLTVGDELMEIRNRPGFEPKQW